MVCDEFGRPELAVAEFGMLMNIAAPRDHLGLECLDLRDDRGREDVGLLRAGDRCGRQKKSESCAHLRDVEVPGKLRRGRNWGQTPISEQVLIVRLSPGEMGL